MPMTVLAQVEGVKIKSIELIEKSETATEIETARFEGLEVFFNIKFQELNDKAKYKIIIENTSDIEYEIKTTNSFEAKNYLTYEYTFAEEGNIIKPQSNKTLFVEVKYKNEVPEEAYINGKYSQDNVLNIYVDNTPTELPTEPEQSSAESEEEIENPKTGANIAWVILISALIISTVIYFMVQKKLPLRKISIFIIVIGIFLPLIVSAVEKLYIKVNVHLEIEQNIPEIKTFKIICNSSEEYKFEENMTWKEFETSKYNINGFSLSEGDNYGYKYMISLTNENDLFVLFTNSEYIEEKEYQCSADPNELL